MENCVLTTAAIVASANATGADSATFIMTDAKLYVSTVTLSTEGNGKWTKQWNDGLKRSACWNKYKVIDSQPVEIAAANE